MCLHSYKLKKWRGFSSLSGDEAAISTFSSNQKNALFHEKSS